MHVCSHYSIYILYYSLVMSGFAHFGYVTVSQTYDLSTGVMTNDFLTAPGSNISSCFISEIYNL